ncbi:MAG: hypothetical protein JOZ99_06625 [Actinobacteria bacterium]|nr:hypothetical protein [Actinomycetota bacterium]
MAQLRKRNVQAGSGKWVTDPMARLLFKSGPPLPAQQGLMPPFPFASLDEMHDAWRDVRDALLPELRAELRDAGADPWAEREWGAQ